jgi:16S rRNA (cytosine967-C5)-methyltransferase
VVLLDAPCTGLGTLRRNPDLVLRSSEEALVESVARQRRLLVSAILTLKPGGRLVYATCSVVPDENEGVIHNLLANDERVRPLSLATTWGPELAQRLKASYEVNLGPGPTEDGPDGFYLALLERV